MAACLTNYIKRFLRHYHDYPGNVTAALRNKRYFLPAVSVLKRFGAISELCAGANFSFSCRVNGFRAMAHVSLNVGHQGETSCDSLTA